MHILAYVISFYLSKLLSFFLIWEEKKGLYMPLHLNVLTAQYYTIAAYDYSPLNGLWFFLAWMSEHEWIHSKFLGYNPQNFNSFLFYFVHIKYLKQTIFS